MPVFSTWLKRIRTRLFFFLHVWEVFVLSMYDRLGKIYEDTDSIAPLTRIITDEYRNVFEKFRNSRPASPAGGSDPNCAIRCLAWEKDRRYTVFILFFLPIGLIHKSVLILVDHR